MFNEMPVFDYEDIQLVPNKCIISSRSEADTTVTLGKYSFKLPVVPANMETIMDEDIAEQLAKNGYFYIMHRFDEVARKPFIARMHAQGLIASISVGVKDYEYAFVTSLKDDAPEFITIDIAHGHSDAVIKMIQHIKKELPETFVIAGNVGTPEAVRSWKMREQMRPRWELDLARFVSPRSKLVLGQGAGNWLPSVGVPRPLENPLLRMVGFGLMVILPSPSASGPAWS